MARGSGGGDAIMSSWNKTRKDYRNRIKEIIDWTKYTYPAYYTIGVRDLTEEEMTNKVFFHNNKQDLIYEGINVGIIRSFLSVKIVEECNANGGIMTLALFSHIRKYDDAIKWCAEISKAILPREYFYEMDSFISASKTNCHIFHPHGIRKGAGSHVCTRSWN